MHSVSGNTTDFSFNCSNCIGDDRHIRGQHGGHLLVKAPCPASHVFHLECITRWLESDQQKIKKLDERQYSQCMQPALPLVPLDGSRVPGDESPYCESPMLNACRTGNLETLKILLAKDETLANRTYRSALTGHPEHPTAVAINYGHTDCVKALVDCHADANAAGHDGETPLQNTTTRQRHTIDLQMLLTGAGVNIDNVLHTAVREGNAELLEYLNSTQPSQRALDNALNEAARQGQTQCLEPLINMGANDLDGALREASRWRKTQCLELLISKGAKDLYGALYIAVLTENIEIRYILVNKGADLHTVWSTNNIDNPMKNFIGRIIFSYLHTTNETDIKPLHSAAAKGYTKGLKKLIETRGVDVNATDYHDYTALRIAACCGHTETVKALLDISGILVDVGNTSGDTALHLAVYRGDTEIVKLLLDADGIDVNEKTNKGWTALHQAANNGNTEIVKMLLAASGIQINEQTNAGSTALTLATSYGYTACAKLLAESRAVDNPSPCPLQ
ncbi:ankyrin repeat domain-containing protein [Thalassotalea sp. G20_0]|uniref:ankyrin repeat domain-containing protein n=1 Tax=Thalassotalea sp. G20_0 TaxID=2821093 RepID=UPI001ADC239C|nr:ankyrin repeat domain-containing protein [Thalassotalea sp. G20_0]MBO9494473.1 ankyrin repeat domain-containing protein [Thalassotalea sp. G20_0]